MKNISLIEKALEKTLRQNSKWILDYIEDIQDLKSIQNFKKPSGKTESWEKVKKDLGIKSSSRFYCINNCTCFNFW